MCRDELCLKASILSQLNHKTSTAEHAKLSSIFDGEGHQELLLILILHALPTTVIKPIRLLFSLMLAANIRLKMESASVLLLHNPVLGAS